MFFRPLCLSALLALPLSWSIAQAQTTTFIDDMGRDVAVQLPVERAVIFNRYGVEFARALRAMDRVVGIDQSTYRDPPYWPELNADMIVGAGQAAPNYEAIVAARPDIVILPRNGAWEEAAAQLEPFGIPVMVITAWDATKHVENVTLMGDLFDAPERAQALNDFYTGYLTLLEERLAGVEPASIYIEETRPLVTVTPGSGWHDMALQGGALNVFGSIDIAAEPASRGNVNAFTIDPEELVSRSPDLIFRLVPGAYESIPADIYAAAWAELSTREEIRATPAWDAGNVHLVNYYLAGGASKITGALQIAKWAHPDLFADIDPEDAMRVWIEEFQGLPYQSGMTHRGQFQP
ncbi:ABC transporter substrate-binding protein [Roseinatronobacter alkalisoli]|uniref:ABC transporter substrate-binding protein n=1 Tax=Roseinatronobacter alkalisoli TaxID=3028235 RepID=A0ABT5TFN9_9RHOB|nr:ABC transporter substrate-binding protein [Roseinatronobacter sp. HJB301]MDD7972723.1 ABC transporter substrate-binding protein [Roseinatronobacter sp. HJB301]